MAAHKTAYFHFNCHTPLGHLKHQVIPFGLTIATVTFQAIISDVIQSMLIRLVFIYINDILMISQRFTEHLICLVLGWLLENKLCVKGR